MTDSTWGSDPVHPKDDPRSVNELISAALSEPDENLAWYAIGALHWRGSREVLDEASRLCRSFCTMERGLAADILAQLGYPDRSFPEECVRLLLDMLKIERVLRVLPTILIALGHSRKPEVIAAISSFRRHEAADVRYGVVQALLGCEDPRAIDTLIDLSTYDDDDVRNWAIFGLGTQVDVDTPELRKALAARLDDPDDDTRCEAIVGLARRRDRHMLPVLRRVLTSRSVSNLEVEAASLIGDPELHPLLLALREWWDIDQKVLDEAIQACAPHPKCTA